ncbi:MAG TPA: hypothetical protein VGX22_10755, partial [Candidatus Dormibacteraeota bacterium]|nr:hypothetical protein [Candidatus Dormibacteraeota bacterium]
DILTGATYLPPEQMASALARIATYYRNNQAEIASRVLEARKRSAGVVARSAGSLEPGLVESVLDAVKAAYDPAYGGFGGAPKFPQTDALLLLLEQSKLRSDEELRRMAVHTLEQMTSGGTYDHVEGGFFRYSTTQDWSVPHFEKMLEDHAGLVQALAVAGMGDALAKTTGYLDRVLRDPATGLYGGSQDADEHYYSLDAAERAKLTPPYVDHRVYTAWNAALAISYLDAGLDPEQMLDSLFARAYRRGEGMMHAEAAGRAQGAPLAAGQLGDQVWSLWAAVRSNRIEIALDLSAHLEERYADHELGGYFDHAGGEELGRLDERIKPLAENSVAAMALTELDTFVGDPSAPYRERARRALESVAQLPRQYGLMAAVFARALDRLPHAIKVSTRNAELARAARAAHPYAVIDTSGPPGARRAHPEQDGAVVCVGTICLAPVFTPEGVKEAIREATQARAPGEL